MVRTSRKLVATDSTDTDESAAPEDHQGRPGLTRLWLTVSAVVVALVHLGIADPRAGPRIFADEIGYLADARYLAGGRVIDMSHTAFYAGGFSIVIAPLSRLFAHNPSHFYESIVFVQAVLAGVSVVVIAQICRWLFATRWSVAIVAATAAGLYPAFVINTGFTWAESMLTFALIVTIGAVVWTFRALDANPTRRGTAAMRAVITGCLCGYVVTIHNRTVLAMLAVVMIVGLALLRKNASRAAVAIGTGFVVTAALGQLLNRQLNQALWGGVGSESTSGRVTQLVHPHGFWLALRAAVGQYWYQFVATGGIVAVALTALVLFALHNRRKATAASNGSTVASSSSLSSSRATVAITVFAVFVALLGVSAVFLANGNRADTIVYGRYVDIVTPLLVAIGIAWLATAPAVKSLGIAAAAVVASSAGWIVLHFGARLELARPYNRVTTFGILGWLDPHRSGPMLFVPTAWAVAIALVALAISSVARHQPAPVWITAVVVAAGVASLFGWQLTFAHRTVLNSLASQAASTRATVQVIRDTGTSELAIDTSITVVDRLGFAFWLPDVKIVDTTPSLASCSQVVSIARGAPSVPGRREIATTGVFHLFRGVGSCPP